RFRNLEDPDFFSPSNIADVILIVQEKKFHVSRQILAHQSSFFDALFYSDFKESKESEITLEDIVHEVFFCFFFYFFFSNLEILQSNVEFVVKLADRFNMKRILDRAEKWLNSDDNEDMEIHDKLRLSDQYHLDLLQLNCISSIDSIDQIVEVKKSDSYQFLSEEIKDELFDKMVKLWE
ncbi:hypothetical protein PFISCL1PPCAC_21745, partial [Pristionchus fissidentatus]